MDTDTGPGLERLTPAFCECSNSERPQKRMCLIRKNIQKPKHPMNPEVLTLENFTLDHRKSHYREPSKGFGNNKLQSQRSCCQENGQPRVLYTSPVMALMIVHNFCGNPAGYLRTYPLTHLVNAVSTWLRS